MVRQLLEQSEAKRATLYFSTVTLTEIISSLVKAHGDGVARDEIDVVLTLPAQVEAPSREHLCTPGG